jgi:hypothetical protein
MSQGDDNDLSGQGPYTEATISTLQNSLNRYYNSTRSIFLDYSKIMKICYNPFDDDDDDDDLGGRGPPTAFPSHLTISDLIRRNKKILETQTDLLRHYSENFSHAMELSGNVMTINYDLYKRSLKNMSQDMGSSV